MSAIRTGFGAFLAATVVAAVAAAQSAPVRDCSADAVRARVVGGLDADGDGTLAADELAARRGGPGMHGRRGRGGPGTGHGRGAGCPDGDCAMRGGGRGPAPHPRMLALVYDENGSGALEPAELDTAVGDLQARCQARGDALVRDFDADRDGRLSDAEWQTFRDDRREQRQACRARRDEAGKAGRGGPMLARLDPNGDGRLDAAERAAARAFLRSGELPACR